MISKNSNYVKLTDIQQILIKLNCAIKCKKVVFIGSESVFREKLCTPKQQCLTNLGSVGTGSEKSLESVFLRWRRNKFKNCATYSISQGGLEFFEASFVVQDL